MIAAQNTVLWVSVCAETKETKEKKGAKGAPYVTVGRIEATAKRLPPRGKATLEEKVGKYGFQVNLVPSSIKKEKLPGAIRVDGPQLRVLDICNTRLPPELGIAAGQLASFTVEAEVCLHALDLERSFGNPIVSKHGHGTGWELRVDRRTGPYFILTFTRGPHVEITSPSPVPVPLNKWVRIAASWDVEQHIVRLFLNRELVHSEYLTSSRAHIWHDWATYRPATRHGPDYDGFLEIGRNAAWHDRATTMSVSEVIISRYARR